MDCRHPFVFLIRRVIRGRVEIIDAFIAQGKSGRVVGMIGHRYLIFIADRVVWDRFRVTAIALIRAPLARRVATCLSGL
jgi:hypothetical protein